LRVLGPTFTGVIQIPSVATDEEIFKLDAIGVRGVRFNLVRGGSADVADLDRFARRVWDLARWHAELYADARDLASMVATLSALPAVSIAHLGMSDEGLPTLVKLAEKGMMVKATIDNKAISKVAIKLVRHNDANESYFCDPANEGEELAALNSRGAKLGTKLVAKGMDLEIAPA